MKNAYNIFVERSSTIFQEFLTQNPEMAMNNAMAALFILILSSKAIARIPKTKMTGIKMNI